MFEVDTSPDTWHVTFRHTQFTDDEGMIMPVTIELENGHAAVIVGMTGCQIEHENKSPSYGDAAYCHVTDTYCRNTGRKIALARALHKGFGGEDNRDIRRMFWKQYFETRGRVD